MILDLAYFSKNFYISNQVKFKYTYLLLGLIATSLYIRGFYYLVNILMDEINVCTREKI